MHEWALVDSVVKAAASVAESERLKTIEEIVVVLGELQSIDRQGVDAIFEELKKNAPEVLKNSRLVLETEKTLFKCRACGREFSESDAASLDATEKEAVHFLPEAARVYIKCPACKSPDFKLEKGRGIYVREIRGEK
ncbi:MAG TPA: hydrogenase nickel incorporation protein HypA [Elusimicrobiales bacterium]|nr:hydrogenase nickel incorporation protein HypA [Elusimicrobiales bacterium]